MFWENHPNTNTNNIRFQKVTRIRIRILVFGHKYSNNIRILNYSLTSVLTLITTTEQSTFPGEANWRRNRANYLTKWKQMQIIIQDKFIKRDLFSSNHHKLAQCSCSGAHINIFRYFLQHVLTISLKCNIINTGIAFQRFSGKKCVSTLPRGRFSLMSL